MNITTFQIKWRTINKRDIPILAANLNLALLAFIFENYPAVGLVKEMLHLK
jgi:hypothetical protein